MIGTSSTRRISRRALLPAMIGASALAAEVGKVAQAKRQPPAYDMRNDLQPRRAAIAMWDYSWLKSHYPGGPFENWNKTTDELLERGFNTVRIDAFPFLIGDMSSDREELTIPADPLANWGFSDRDYKHAVARELVEFMGIAKRKNLNVILSTWNTTAKEYPGVADRIAHSRDKFRHAWDRTLQVLGEHDLLKPVLYVDLDQEFPYFSAYGPELKSLREPGHSAPGTKGGAKSAMEEAGQSEQGLTRMAWNPAQLEYVRGLFSEMLPYFQSHYPSLRFTYSLTAFFKEVRSLGLQLFDVLELHLWIHSPRFDNRTGFNQLKKDRGQRSYRDYARRIEQTLHAVRPMLVQEMRNRMKFATEWAGEIAAPLTATEAWGPWWHMDSPDLDWGWLRDWCEQSMKLAGEYGFWGATPWNYSHPYWKNWSDIAWYQRVNNRFLKS
jgi:hypothetical protein